MKIIVGAVFVALVLALLTGCSQSTPASAVHRGIQQCETNGGLKSLSTFGRVVDAYCLNGARFKIDTIRNDLIQ